MQRIKLSVCLTRSAINLLRALSRADGTFLFSFCVELNYGAHLITKTSKQQRRWGEEREKPTAARKKEREERGRGSSWMKKIADDRGRQRPGRDENFCTSVSRTFSASVEDSRDLVHPLLRPCSLFSGVCRLFFHYNEPFAKRRVVELRDATMQGATSIMANGHSV